MLVPIEILDAVQEDYNRDNSIKIFDTAFAGTSFNDSALTLQSWLNLVEECLNAEKAEKLKNLEKKENYQRLRKADKERELEYERERERERNIDVRTDSNVGDFSKHRLQYERPSNSRKETDSSRRRNMQISNRKNQGRENNKNYEIEKNYEMTVPNYLGDEKEYSVFDARAHAVPDRTNRDGTSVHSGSVMRGRPGPGSGVRSRSLSASSTGIKDNKEKSFSIGQEGEGRGHGNGSSASMKYPNNYSNVIGNIHENKGKYAFADSSSYVPSPSRGMMKTRVGHYAHRQIDKQQQQQQQQQHSWDVLNQNKRPPLISKANRAYKLRQQSAFTTGGADNFKNNSIISPESELESDQYIQTHNYNHRDWIRYSYSSFVRCFIYLRSFTIVPSTVYYCCMMQLYLNCLFDLI